jgi:hypothetical protein
MTMSISHYVSLRSGLDRMLSDHTIDCAEPHPGRLNIDAARLEAIQRLVSRITYRDWRVVAVNDDGDQAWMQIQTIMLDSLGGGLMENNSRRIYLCPAMSDDFIIAAALELIKEFEMHEAAEHFLVDGTRTYFPHNPWGQPVQDVLTMQHRKPSDIATA